MAVFITHCSKSISRFVVLMAGLAVALMLTALPAQADSIEVRDARLEAQEDSWILYTEFGLDLSSRLEEAINKGVPLYFNLEFELTRPRWYWLDEKAVQTNQTYKLSYHALTQSYRLSAGSLYQSFSTLGEALRLLARPRMPAFNRQQVKAGEVYVAQVRLRLDVAQLPKPFQINALTSRDWNLESEWRKIPFRADASATSSQSQSQSPAAAASAGAPTTGGAVGSGASK